MHSTTSDRNSTGTTNTDNADHKQLVGILDQPIATGLRVWMLLALILGILIVMMVIACCFVKIRIPRTKREIEMDALTRRKKKLCVAEVRSLQTRTRRSAKVIVMSSLPPANQSLLSTANAELDGYNYPRFSIPGNGRKVSKTSQITA